MVCGLIRGSRRCWRLATRGFYSWQRHCGRRRLEAEVEAARQSVVIAGKWYQQHPEAAATPVGVDVDVIITPPCMFHQ